MAQRVLLDAAQRARALIHGPFFDTRSALGSLHYIGVPRHSVLQRRELLQRQAQDRAVPQMPAFAQGFYAYQAQGLAGQRGGG